MTTATITPTPKSMTTTTRTSSSSSSWKNGYYGGSKKREMINRQSSSSSSSSLSSSSNVKRRRLSDNQLLDPSKPEEARRMQQRKRMIEKGKNTIGYTEYIRQIPKQKRKPKTMDHPSTPNHKADIPNRRWLGLVSAWRVALHQYDPPDCVSDVTMKTSSRRKLELVTKTEEESNHQPVDELDQLECKDEFFLEDNDDDDDLL